MESETNSGYAPTADPHTPLAPIQPNQFRHPVTPAPRCDQGQLSGVDAITNFGGGR